MGYGIVRGKKIKSDGIRGVEIHNNREKRSRSNRNIDPERTKNNFSLQERTDTPLNEKVANRIAELPGQKTKTGKTRKVQSNAVRLYDFFVGFSPEDAKRMTEQEQKNYFRDAHKFFQKRFGAANVVYGEVHMDEETAHAHIGLVPEHKGKLSAKDLFTPKSCRQLQDDFYKEVSSKYGLQRGEVGSEKQHLEPKQYKAKTLAEAKEIEKAVVGYKQGKNALKRINPELKTPTFGIGKEHYELTPPEYKTLRKLAEDGAAAAPAIIALKEKNSELGMQLITADYDRRKAEEAREKAETELNRAEKDKWDIIEKTAIYRESPAWIKRSLEKKSVEIRNFSDSLARITPTLNKVYGEEKTIEIAGKALRRIGITDKQDARDFVRSNSLEASRQRMGKEPSGQKGIWSNPPGAIDFLRASESDFAAVRPSLQMPNDDDWQGLTESAKAERMADHRFDEDWSR